MGEHPAARMLAAAKLLREQAGAARDLTGDGHGDWSTWSVVKDTKWVKFPEPRQVPAAPYPFGDGGTEFADGQYEPTGQAFVAHDQWAHDDEEAWHEPVFFAGPMPEPLAAYITTMNPLVGLALAGLLDRIAWLVKADGADCAAAINEAEALTRLCLGEEQENNPR